VTTLTAPQVYALARSAGLDPAQSVIATAVATAESGLRTDAMGDIGLQNATWGPSVGLWQIRSVKAETGKGTSRDVSRLTDPAFNAKAMAAISGQGTNFRPWSTYTNNAYKKNIPAVSGTASSVETDPGWQSKLSSMLSSLPGSSQASAGIGALTGAAGTAAAALNPTAGWAQQAGSIALKITMVGAGLGLVIVGAVRLVAPGAQRAISSTLEAAQ
jgi:predicted phage tail protein